MGICRTFIVSQREWLFADWVGILQNTSPVAGKVPASTSLSNSTILGYPNSMGGNKHGRLNPVITITGLTGVVMCS